MKKKQKFLLVLSVIIISGITAYSLDLFKKPKAQNCDPATFIDAPLEIEPKFLIRDDNAIVFSGKGNDSYRLHLILNGKEKMPADLPGDTFNPFLVKGELAGLVDNKGDENYVSTNKSLNEALNFKPIKTIFSFKNGYLLIVQLKDDLAVYLMDLKNNKKEALLYNVRKLHQICFSEEHNFIIANYDDKLSCIDLNHKEHLISLATNQQSESMNPSVQGNDLYFSNNANSEFYQIFRINLKNGQHGIPELVWHSNHDVRMPKLRGNDLYCIEIVNSEYLLRKINISSRVVQDITQKGVVYNYDFDRKGKIIFSYCDFTTPKSIIQYESNGSFTNFSGGSVTSGLRYKLVSGNDKHSAAYIISPAIKAKGVILFFHPGLHSDFSPRWDTVLMNISRSGYILICPNYPISTGFGKTYYSADLSAAIADITDWKEYIKDSYDLPLYYLSSSSGNVLMEQSLSEDHKGISASVSLFGVPLDDQPTPPVPSLYLLGENDPVINFSKRHGELESAKEANSDINVVSYKDEGHWFRSSMNMKDAVGRIVKFFCNNS